MRVHPTKYYRKRKGLCSPRFANLRKQSTLLTCGSIRTDILTRAVLPSSLTATLACVGYYRGTSTWYVYAGLFFFTHHIALMLGFDNPLSRPELWYWYRYTCLLQDLPQRFLKERFNCFL